MEDHILIAYEFDNNGGGKPLGADEISQALESKRLAWMHMDADSPETTKWLNAELSYLDPFIVTALVEEETRPRMIQIKEGCLLILRGVNLNPNADPEDMVSMRLWIDRHRIISVRKRKLKVEDDLVEKLQSGVGPRNAGEFASFLVSRLFERMGPVLNELDEWTDNIEEQILESASSEQRENIVDIRKKAIILRRYLAPQRDAIATLRMAELDWLDEKDRRQLQESLNRITRYVEDLDALRERAQIVKDEIANMLSDKLNKNMYILSVIAAIFLPLGFLTGLLGINVGGIPGASNDDAFWLFAGGLVVLVIAQIAVFKRYKWF